MSLIIYSKNTNPQEYGIRQITNSLLKKLIHNKIHKKCLYSISREKIIEEFKIDNNFVIEHENADDDVDIMMNDKNIMNNDINKKDIDSMNMDVVNDVDEEDEDVDNIDEDDGEMDEEVDDMFESENIIENETTTKSSNIDVLIMTELNKNQLETYLKLYKEPKNNLDKFIELYTIISYNQINPEKFKIKKKLNSLLCSLSEYWEDPVNCSYTLTDKFVKRKFNNVEHDEFTKNTNDQVKNNFKFDYKTKEINYLHDIIKFNDWKELCVHKYYDPIKSSFTNEDIVHIYNQLSTEYLKYMFVSNMLGSRTHVHLILNNRKFLEISKDLFSKYKLVFKYLIGYAWLTLKNEEQHVYHKITDKDRIIFDIETVKLLPKYPFTYDDINQNPYACVLVDTNVLDIKKNCLSMEMMRDYEKYYGICDLEEFKKRLNIFVNNGTNCEGILEYINWDCCAISGSAMTACGMKYNPLIDISKTNNDFNVVTDEDHANYFFHYYSNSDIDLICNKKSMYDFIDVVDTFVVNAKKKYDKITTTNIHTASMIISDEFLLEELTSISLFLNDESINVSFIKSNLNEPNIVKYFYQKYYMQWKTEQKNFLLENNKDITKGLICDYLEPISENEFKLYILTYETDKFEHQDYEKYFYSNSSKTKIISAKLSEHIRFKISNPNFRTFEIFKSKNSNFFSMISKFHMGFVRALWNGKTLLCLPSYISSMMLQLSIDYRYFASVRDPIEIVNKYRSRGFGIILNGYEKLHMAYYNSFATKDNCNANWINMYKVNVKSKQSVENIFGIKKSSDEIFKPSKYFIGIPDDCYKNIKHDTLSNFDECFGSIIKSSNIPSIAALTKAKAINDNGKINPLSRDVINLGWVLLNK